MGTNILALVIITLVTNITNSTLEMPLSSSPVYIPIGELNRGSEPRRPQIQRVVGTNVFERATIIWTINGQTNVCSVDRLIYSASQVLRLKESWEAGPLTINQP